MVYKLSTDMVYKIAPSVSPAASQLHLAVPGIISSHSLA